MDVMFYKQLIFKGYHPIWFEIFISENFDFETALEKYDAEYHRIGVDFPLPSFIDTVSFKTNEGYMEFYLTWM